MENGKSVAAVGGFYVGGPESIAAQSANAGSDGHGVEAEIGEQHPRQNDPDGDMPQRAQKREHDFPDAVIIPCECVSGKAEYIKQGYHPQIPNGLRESNPFMDIQQYRDRIGRQNKHSHGRKHPGAAV